MVFCTQASLLNGSSPFPHQPNSSTSFKAQLVRHLLCEVPPNTYTPCGRHLLLAAKLPLESLAPVVPHSRTKGLTLPLLLTSTEAGTTSDSFLNPCAQPSVGAQ